MRSKAERAARARAQDELARGRVLAGYGRQYLVEEADGSTRLCHPRGKKSEAVVGDIVRWAPTAEGEGVIEGIDERRNLLYRQDEWKTKSFAANIDQLLVLIAVDPVFSESQLARALIAAHQAGIPVRIALNKIDLDATQARERLAPYRAMGLDVTEVSLAGQPEAALDLMRPWLQGKVTLVLGPSGTGKSSLINLLHPQAQAQVGEISAALNSGRHTTTHTRWYWLDRAQGTALLDSPGFQEFGLHHVPVEDLPQHMADFAPLLGQCRFYNCTHQHEPGCAIRTAVDDGRIAPSRYRIYLELLAQLQAPRW